MCVKGRLGGDGRRAERQRKGEEERKRGRGMGKGEKRENSINS